MPCTGGQITKSSAREHQHPYRDMALFFIFCMFSSALIIYKAVMGPEHRPLNHWPTGSTAETGTGLSHTWKIQHLQGVNLSVEKRDWGHQKDRP
jgi:hypothetical protein